MCNFTKSNLMIKKGRLRLSRGIGCVLHMQRERKRERGKSGSLKASKIEIKITPKTNPLQTSLTF